VMEEVSHCHKKPVEYKKFPVPHIMCTQCLMPCEVRYKVKSERLWRKTKQSTT
jgi:hypothetical protein